jgi:deazaflavin-dependent oxidoreductase (nitroreductase family)
MPRSHDVVARNGWLIPWISRIHGALYRWSDGRIGAGTRATQLLLLTTTGRKSGQPRSTPLLYVSDGDRWVVIGSNGGSDRAPAWWLNLQACPEASIQCGRERHAVHARRATPEEEERLWPKLTEAYAFFPAYRERTDREIPIIVLERAA